VVDDGSRDGSGSRAAREPRSIGLIDDKNPLDSVVIRVPKAYPAYTGTYARFDELRSYLDGFENLFLNGRNAMHRYNNQDHSMLATMCPVSVATRISRPSSRQLSTLPPSVVSDQV